MLLPSRFQPEALPAPGPAIRKPEPVKADPIREFETAIFLPPKADVVFGWAESKHAIRDHTKSGAAQASTAAPAISAKPEAAPPRFSLDLGSGEVKAEEPKFRVGDRVRVTAECSFRGFVGHITSVLNACYMLEGCLGTIRLVRFGSVELVEPAPTSDGWNGELVVGKVYLTRPAHSREECFFSRWDGRWMFDSRRAQEAASSRYDSHTQDRTVIREATEAELRGEA